MTKLYGSLEAGGTKFICAVGDENFNVVEKTQFPTTTPIETLDKTSCFECANLPYDRCQQLSLW